MSHENGLERRLTDFYASEGDLRAPDRVLSASLATVDTTHQRRVFGAPWRSRDVSNFVKLAAAAVAVVAAVAIGWALYAGNQGIGRPPPPTPTPTPSATPSPSPSEHALTETFTSAIHGMSVDYPQGSTVVPGSGPWTTGLPGSDDPPSRDTIWISQDDNIFIGLASQPLAARSGDEWIAEISGLPDWGAVACGSADREPVTIDGATGFVVFCADRPLHAIVTDGTRGYFVSFYGSQDRAWFDEILATVQLEPGAAASPSPTLSPDHALTQTFTSAIHGMSVGYPAGSTVEPGAGPWTTGMPGSDDPPSRDTIWISTSDNVFIGLASQPLAGRSGDEWIAEISGQPDWGAAVCGTSTADREPVTVDGATGFLVHCRDRPLHAIVTDGQRGYFVVLYGSKDRVWFVVNYGSKDRQWFDEILATVQLDPAAAVNPSASPSSSP